MSLLAGSPAIGAGNAAAANLPATDQRSLPRVTGGKLDIGAFQTQPPPAAVQTLHSFTTADGGSPTSALVVAGSTLYGTTGNTVFSMNTDGGGFTVLHTFSGSDGYDPNSLIVAGSTIYGTTYGITVGLSDGTLFSMNTDGSGFKVLHTFSGADGAGPNGLTLVGSTFFGTTVEGGTGVTVSGGDGTVFSINTDGSGFQVLHSFTGGSSDGYQPQAGLTAVGSTLYGATAYSGAGSPPSDGTLFSIDTDGSGYQVLHWFDKGGAAEGFLPQGGLAAIGSVLYGAAGGDGSNNDGTLFSIHADGSGFQLLNTFATTGNDGLSPSRLTAVGSTLFGTAIDGGTGAPYPGDGTLFSLNTDGSGFRVLYSFTGGPSDGSHPSFGLTPAGSLLLGTTGITGKGDSGLGTLFSYRISAANVTNATTTEGAQTTSGLVITPNAADVAVVNSFQITNVTGGSLFLQDGVTPVTNGQFITVAQGEAGLKFTANPGPLANGSFVVEESTTGDASGLIAASFAAATITVQPVTWTGGGDGHSWNDPANWNDDVVPVNGNDVVINVAGNPTVVYGASAGNIALSSLTLGTGDALSIAGGGLTVNGTFSAGGAEAFSGRRDVRQRRHFVHGRRRGLCQYDPRRAGQCLARHFQRRLYRDHDVQCCLRRGRGPWRRQRRLLRGHVDRFRGRRRAVQRQRRLSRHRAGRADAQLPRRHVSMDRGSFLVSPKAMSPISEQ